MSQAELNGELFTLERFPPNAEEEALQGMNICCNR